MANRDAPPRGTLGADEVLALVASLRQALGQDLLGFAQAHGYHGDAVRRGMSYGQMVGLNSLHDAEVGPATYYANPAQIVLAYTQRLSADVDAVIKRLGKPGADLRSRVGKQYLQHVFPDQGVAFASRRGEAEIRTLEVFAPRTLNEYKAEFYDDPGRFEE